MKKHDENKDVRLLSQIGKINPITKTISIPKSINIGNRRWGRIDYLVNILHYVLVREGMVMNYNTSSTSNKSYNDIKKQKQERKHNAKVEEKKQLKSKRK